APASEGPKADDPKTDGPKTDDPKTDDAEPEERKKFKHKGFIVDLRLGVMGCTRAICKRHGARPGFRIDGILGRNFLGFLDLALAGGWGRMATRVAPGTSGLALYGLDASALPPEAALLMFDQFTVDEARLESIQAGLDLRVHVIPRGRVDPYVGAGVQYSLFRGRYETPGGPTRLGFHGVAFPLQAGLVVFAHENFAFGAQFDYLVSWYGGITVRGAPGRFAAPIVALQDTAAMAGVKLPGDLPHLWSVGAVVHVRLGK
ncbi:MAG: hypothetical protein KDK70_26525, partial [Myxococcales bacterium]|nr:hypothetical protein [Myxococcales bacterium]